MENVFNLENCIIRMYWEIDYFINIRLYLVDFVDFFFVGGKWYLYRYFFGFFYCI